MTEKTKPLRHIYEAGKYLLIVLVSFFILQTALILMHEFMHSTVAWLFGDMGSPFGIVWGNPLMMTGWDEGVHYSKLFPAPGNPVEAVIGASPLVMHTVIVIAGLLLMQRPAMLKRKWTFHAVYWFVVANLMELVAYIAMRGFASGGDTGHFNHGLNLSPWYLFIAGNLLLLFALTVLFRKAVPRMYSLFASENPVTQWLILILTAFFLFLWGSGIRVVSYIYPDPQWIFGLIGFAAFPAVLFFYRPNRP